MPVPKLAVAPVSEPSEPILIDAPPPPWVACSAHDTVPLAAAGLAAAAAGAVVAAGAGAGVAAGLATPVGFAPAGGWGRGAGAGSTLHAQAPSAPQPANLATLSV